MQNVVNLAFDKGREEVLPGLGQAFHALARHANGVGIVHGGMLAAFMDGVLAGSVWRGCQRRWRRSASSRSAEKYPRACSGSAVSGGIVMRPMNRAFG